MMHLSVCMATYNGAAFVFDQLSSIVSQLEAGDQIIIVDDCSTDNTLAEVDRAIGTAPHLGRNSVVILHNAENRGHVASFERAIGAATNDIVVLADQDDVWLAGYSNKIRAAFETDDSLGLLVARPVFCDEDLNRLAHANARYRHPHIGGALGVLTFILNRAMPIGCTMSLRRTELAYLSPFPDRLLAHDHWIFAMATLRRRMQPLNDESVYYRRHAGVVTHRLSPTQRVRSRVHLAWLLLHRLPRSDRPVDLYPAPQQ